MLHFSEFFCIRMHDFCINTIPATWLASVHRAIMCPREALPHCHACAAQNRDLRWTWAASKRYSAVREISTVSRLHDECNKCTVNTQQDLSEWWTMYQGHGYHPWDHSETLKLTHTWARTPVKEVQRGLLWRNRYSSEGSSELLQGL